jgi:hypothetical protein
VSRSSSTTLPRSQYSITIFAVDSRASFTHSYASTTFAHRHSLCILISSSAASNSVRDDPTRTFANFLLFNSFTAYAFARPRPLVVVAVSSLPVVPVASVPVLVLVLVPSVVSLFSLAYLYTSPYAPRPSVSPRVPYARRIRLDVRSAPPRAVRRPPVAARRPQHVRARASLELESALESDDAVARVGMDGRRLDASRRDDRGIDR